MRKLIGSFLIASTMFMGVVPVVMAGTSTTTTSSLQQMITSLLQQIADLKAKLAALQTAQNDVNDEQKSIEQGVAQIRREIHEGDAGNDVEILQQLLALDPSVYPEGFVTSFYGKKTARAIRLFQHRYHITGEDGRVGPKTMQKINELLSSPDLAPAARTRIADICRRAPALLSIDCHAFLIKKWPHPGHTGSSTVDTVAPVISNITATTTSATATHILWDTNEQARGRVWYATSSTPILIRLSTLHADSIAVRHHNVLLSGLTASTTYHYLIVAWDLSGNPATSSTQSFLTH